MSLFDVHAHFLPPAYRDALTTAGIDRPDGFPVIPQWSAAEHVGVLDRLGIATAMLSVSSPGVHFGDGLSVSDAVALARHVNDVAAATIRSHPGRFGAFASVALPHLDAALAETERALDGLGLHGINVLTNVAGVYLGDPSLDPLMAELHLRNAVVFVHPTSPPCFEKTSLGYPRPMIEFPFDTTRAVTNLILTGTLERFPGIRWIIPHAGGTLPFLSPRIAAVSTILGRDPAVVLRGLRSLFYDLAGSANRVAVETLLAVADRANVLYGSDWPFTPEGGAAAGVRWLGSTDNPLRPEVLTANAWRLFPTLGSSSETSIGSPT